MFLYVWFFVIGPRPVKDLINKKKSRMVEKERRDITVKLGAPTSLDLNTVYVLELTTPLGSKVSPTSGGATWLT